MAHRPQPLFTHYPKIKKRALEATRELVSAGVDGPIEDIIARIDAWLVAMCEIYEVPEISFNLLPQPGPGYCDGVQIHMADFDWCLLFHQFRHHLQHCGVANDGDHPAQREGRAYGWAASLYHYSCPGDFQRAVRRGWIPFVHMIELLAPQTKCKPLDDTEQDQFDTMAEALMEDITEDPDFLGLVEKFTDGP